MKLPSFLFVTPLIFALFIFRSLPAYAADILSLVPASGNGSFILTGEGMIKVGTFDITISYDAATLTKPRVTTGSLLNGALYVSNVERPGIIRIVGVHPSGINGSGTFIVLNFDSIGNSTGKVVLEPPRIGDMNGIPIIASTVGQGQSDQSTVVGNQQTTDGAVTGLATRTSVGNGQMILLGGVLAPAESIPASESKSSPFQLPDQGLPPSPPATEPSTESRTEPRTEPKPSAPVKTVSEESPGQEPLPDELHAQPTVVNLKGVLAGFRDYQGEPSKSAFLALFEQNEQKMFRQEPPVALADGTTAVRIFVTIPEASKNSPTFALMGAKMISLKMVGGEWVVEALPERGAYEASLSCLTGATIIGIPLTIAPRIDADLDKSGKVTEKDFVLYLTQRISKKPAAIAVVVASRPTYIDDFIFTANYLVAMRIVAPSEKTVLKENHNSR